MSTHRKTKMLMKEFIDRLESGLYTLSGARSALHRVGWTEGQKTYARRQVEKYFSEGASYKAPRQIREAREREAAKNTSHPYVRMTVQDFMKKVKEGAYPGEGRARSAIFKAKWSEKTKEWARSQLRKHYENAAKLYVPEESIQAANERVEVMKRRHSPVLEKPTLFVLAQDFAIIKNSELMPHVRRLLVNLQGLGTTPEELAMALG